MSPNCEVEKDLEEWGLFLYERETSCGWSIIEKISQARPISGGIEASAMNANPLSDSSSLRIALTRFGLQLHSHKPLPSLLPLSHSQSIHRQFTTIPTRHPKSYAICIKRQTVTQFAIRPLTSSRILTLHSSGSSSRHIQLKHGCFGLSRCDGDHIPPVFSVLFATVGVDYKIFVVLNVVRLYLPYSNSYHHKPRLFQWQYYHTNFFHPQSPSTTITC